MKFAFMVEDLGPTQLAYQLLTQVNKSMRERDDLDIVAFYENLLKPCIAPGFMTTNISDSWSFNSSIVATSLSTAYKLIHIPSAKKKFFYCYDLEWLYLRNRCYEDLSSIYHHPSLQLIARSESHKTMLENCWNKEVKIVSDFDIDQFLQLGVCQ